jgi:hypothetical protein
MKLINYSDWGNPLVWDISFQCHELFQKYSDNLDPFFWMTQDYEVEV